VFGTVPLSIIRSFSLYMQQTCMICTIAVCTVKNSYDGQRNWLKQVEFYSKNKYEKLVHLVGFIIRRYCIHPLVALASPNVFHFPPFLTQTNLVWAFTTNSWLCSNVVMHNKPLILHCAFNFKQPLWNPVQHKAKSQVTIHIKEEVRCMQVRTCNLSFICLSEAVSESMYILLRNYEFLNVHTSCIQS